MVRGITGVGIMLSGSDKMDLLGLYLEMESEGLDLFTSQRVIGL